MKTINRVIGSEVVIDTGIVIEYLEGSSKGEKLKQLIFDNKSIVSILTTPVLLVEVYYILRRKSSKLYATEVIQKLDNILTVIPLHEYRIHCGESKATNPFSISDCCSLALAEYKDIKVLFIHETEIDRQLLEVGTNQYTERIVFIDDFPIFKS